MLSAANPSTRFLGCGKTEIVVFDATAKRSRTLVNETKVLTEFAAEPDARCVVVCEAAGGYESELLAALLASGVLVHVGEDLCTSIPTSKNFEDAVQVS